MLSAFKKFQEHYQLKKELFAFLAEMEKNLELFYVMDQRQFITGGFIMDTWPRVKGWDIIKKHEAIGIYGAALENFNNLFKAYKDYEAWYTADIQRKTPENAKKLHGLKHDLDKTLKGMEAVIIPAGQALERQMLDLGLLKA
jgi:hypothetical protein